MPSDSAFIAGLARRFAEFTLPPWRTSHDVVNGTAAQLETALHANDERSEIIIAETADGQRAGFVWMILVRDFYTGDDVAKISEIAAVRDGSGAGTALMDAAAMWARKRGAQLLTLNVMEGNTRARAFYTRHGFAPEYTNMAKDLRHE